MGEFSFTTLLAEESKSQGLLASKKFKVIALSIGQGLSSVIIILVGMVMARVLSKGDVAAYQQTFLAYQTIAPFLALGIGHGIYYFVPIEKLRIRGIVVESIMVLGVMGLLFAVFILLGGNNLLAQRFDNPKVADLLIWMIPYALFMVPASHHAAVLVARDKAGLSAAWSILVHLTIGLVTIFLLLIYQNVQIAFLGNVIISILTALCSIILMVKSTPADDGKPSLTTAYRLVAYSFPLGLASMIGLLALSMDRILVSLMLEPEVYAVYAFGAKEIPLISIFLSSIAAVLVVQMRKEVAAGNHNEAASLFKRCSQITMPILFPIGAFFMVNSEEIIQILYTSSYREAAIPFSIYAGTVLIRTCYFGPLLAAYGQNWFILWSTSAVLLVNILGSYFAIQNFGAPGAAWATLMVLVLVNTPLSYWKLCRVSGLSIKAFLPFRDLLKNTLIIIALVCCFLLIELTLVNVSLIVNTIVLGAVLCFLNREQTSSIVNMIFGKLRPQA